MSVSKLPSGRWRAQVYDPSVGHNVSVSKVIGPPGTFATKRDAKAARERARAVLGGPRSGVTVGEWRDRWLTDPLFARPKQSTMRHNTERTKAFAAKHRDLPLERVDDAIVAEWLAGGARNGQVSALRAMFSDAASKKAGRLITVNPWAGLGIERTTGNRDKQPPAEHVVWELIRAARKVATPAFASWLQVAAFTGMRPGELDALRWTAVDLEEGRIRVAEQLSAGTAATFTTPKNGQARWAPLTPPAREALVATPRESEFCFVNLRGTHWTSSARAYHWKATRAAVGWEGSLYLATRHFAGWYMVNVLELPSEDVAIALGHTDGGDLVRKLYGHRDREKALKRVREAYESVGNVTPLRVVKDETG